MIEYVISQGWKYIGTCNCSGNPKKYLKGDWTIKIFVSGKRWELYERGRGKIQGKENQLLEALNTYVKELAA